MPSICAGNSDWLRFSRGCNIPWEKHRNSSPFRQPTTSQDPPPTLQNTHTSNLMQNRKISPSKLNTIDSSLQEELAHMVAMGIHSIGFFAVCVNLQTGIPSKDAVIHHLIHEYLVDHQASKGTANEFWCTWNSILSNKSLECPAWGEYCLQQHRHSISSTISGPLSYLTRLQHIETLSGYQCPRCSFTHTDIETIRDPLQKWQNFHQSLIQPTEERLNFSGKITIKSVFGCPSYRHFFPIANRNPLGTLVHIFKMSTKRLADKRTRASNPSEYRILGHGSSAIKERKIENEALSTTVCVTYAFKNLLSCHKLSHPQDLPKLPTNSYIISMGIDIALDQHHMSLEKAAILTRSPRQTPLVNTVTADIFD